MESDNRKQNIVIDDLRNSGWKEIISKIDRLNYAKMFLAFKEAAEGSQLLNKSFKTEALILLARVCSMLLKSPNRLDDPFLPYSEWNGRRSYLPYDFSDHEIKLLKEFIGEVHNPGLKARIADLVWIRKKDYKNAIMAIEAYMELQLKNTDWFSHNQKCLQRAIYLSKKLNQEDLLNKIETKVLNAFFETTENDTSDTYFLAKLIENYELGKTKEGKIAEALSEKGKRIKDQNKIEKSLKYFEISSRLYNKINDTENINDVNFLLGQCYEAIGNEGLDAKKPNYLSAAFHLEKAIKFFSKIPNKDRNNKKINEKLSELKQKKKTAYEKQSKSLNPIEFGPFDVSDIVERAKDFVSNKSMREALLNFANIDSGANKKNLKKNAKEISKKYFFSSFGSTYIGSDGRKIASSPCIEGKNEESEEYEIKISELMNREFYLYINLITKGKILPALETLHLEYAISFKDFHSLVEGSPFIPDDRNWLMARGLYEGYEEDFTTAIHFLVPQIENLVRQEMKKRKVETTSTDGNGVDYEVGLSTLMIRANKANVFEENLAFEIESIFCNPFGPNLRNNIAHGLFSSTQFFSVSCIYAWWFCLKIVVNSNFQNIIEQNKLC